MGSSLDQQEAEQDLGRENLDPSSPGTTWDPKQGLLQLLADSWAAPGQREPGAGPLTGSTWTTVLSGHGVPENCG